MFRRIFLSAVAGGAATWGCRALAQGAAVKGGVTLLVPFLPGGSSDMVARTLSAKFQEQLGQPVVVTHAAAAGGDIAAAQLKRARPDGRTLMIASAGMLAIAPNLHGSTTYDPMRDFDYITVAVRVANVLVVPASSPVKSVSGLVAVLKEHPGMVAFGSSGRGSSDHLTAELFWLQTGTKGLHMPDRGGRAATEELLGGTVHAAFQNVNVVINHIRSGRLRPLAVTGHARSALLPGVPTLAECGVQGVEVYSWQAVVAPRGLGDPVKKALHAALAAALNETAVRSRLVEQGFEIVASTPSQAARLQATEYARWKQLIKARGISAS
ncbi:Bug family tripartite tricarboxylate transporter substrate binding protein [Azohydromonas australica]|uniref:Bug family tripartite tricarboxylate transporter substrate binding protein n=1 Tax=Azohydromonas australica TaxID=364039 RepID=UPI0004123296|nr:tripartite tricarboxylate transporter substrate binding protein [Azohydromonas australica]